MTGMESIWESYGSVILQNKGQTALSACFTIHYDIYSLMYTILNFTAFMYVCPVLTVPVVPFLSATLASWTFCY